MLDPTAPLILPCPVASARSPLVSCAVALLYDEWRRTGQGRAGGRAGVPELGAPAKAAP